MTARAYARMVSATALTSVACALFVVAPAEALAYRYWTYWQSTDAQSWEFATQGPGTSIPDDGAVEGWSFRVSQDSAPEDDAPADRPDFQALCDGTPKSPGKKRIGLVVDPGAPGYAPAGEVAIAAVATCVSIEVGATGYDVVRSVMDVRTENGLVCGLGGYPTSECAPPLDDDEFFRVTAATEAAAPADDEPTAPAGVTAGDSPGDSPGDIAEAGSPVPTLVVTVLIALAAGATFLWARRRRDRHA